VRGDSVSNETWTHDGASWRRAVSKSGIEPAGRTQHTLTYEATTQSLVLFGGDQPDTSSETWDWKDGTWIATSGAGPSPRAGPAVAWDAQRERLVMFGGQSTQSSLPSDTWVRTGKIWTQVLTDTAPAGRTDHTLTWDASRRQMLLFGGASTALLGDTWLWGETGWVRVDGGKSPAVRARHTMTWDPERKTLILFGGRGTSKVLGDTWQWDGAAWRKLLSAGEAAPPARTNHTMTYDPERRRHVLFGGYLALGAFVPAAYAGDTWLLYLRGGGCTSGDACGSGICNDGVCCEQQTCGTCETCAGLTPGKCSPVINTEDSDTCAYKDKKSCDVSGQCMPSLGASCTKSTDCATGYCSSGICCDTACEGACQSCIASEKIDPTGGRCGPSKAGTNPGARCLEGAICGSSGACEKSKAATCKDATTLIDGNGKESTCGVYRCQGATCRTTCESFSDCAAPNVCISGACVASETQRPATGGCSMAQYRSESDPRNVLAWLACVSLASRVRMRHRRKTSMVRAR
jgi:Galactose oxidase, central domain